MRCWVFAVPLLLAALIGAEYLTAPRPNSTRALLASLADELRFTYHDCVPLGWEPVPVSGTYYPGYTASAQNYGMWLDALWRGRIGKRELSDPHARDVFAVLNRLTAEGLLARKNDSAGYRYFMTPRAIPYFYGSSVFRDNRDSLPYLCYSSIVPQRVDWLSRIAASRRERTPAQWYDVQFSWKPSAPPEWAADAFIRSHSVVLAPITSPTLAKVAYRNGQWQLANIYDRGWMLPALTVPSRPLRLRARHAAFHR